LKYPGAKAPLEFPALLPSGGFSIGGVTISWAQVTVVVVAGRSDDRASGIRAEVAHRPCDARHGPGPDTASLMGVDTNG